MRFGLTEIPACLFEMAQGKMLSESSFTPNSIREYLLSEAGDVLNKISTNKTNQWIITNRVMRFVINELVKKGEVRPIKRGLWSAAN